VAVTGTEGFCDEDDDAGRCSGDGDDGMFHLNNFSTASRSRDDGFIAISLSEKSTAAATVVNSVVWEEDDNDPGDNVNDDDD
jgi:hypothetical protein